MKPKRIRVSRLMRIIPGAFVTLSALLAWLHSPWWLLFTAFVGLNLLQSGFTGWCLMEDALRKAGFPE